MTDTPTLANSGAPASPMSPPPTPASPPTSTPAPAAPPRPSAPPNPRNTGYSPARDRYNELRQDQSRGEAPAPPGGANAAPDQPAPPAADDLQQPAADAGAKVRVGRYEIDEAALGTMLQRQAQEDLRRATVPASAEAYEAKLPADLKLPGNQQFRIDAGDPSLVAARNLAHAKGWSQQDFSDALGIFASHLAGQEFQLAERSRAELAKIGANAPQRVDAACKWLDGFLGTDAAPVKSTMVTASHLKFIEAVMAKLETQGVGRFSQSHRAAPDDQKIPGYESMSFEQRRFAQDQRAAAAARRGRE
jgi:hypothetical protein